MQSRTLQQYEDNPLILCVYVCVSLCAYACVRVKTPTCPAFPELYAQRAVYQQTKIMLITRGKKKRKADFSDSTRDLQEKKRDEPEK